ncbi:hypothetical protein GJQ54_05355 [Oceanospirillaceae bacterium ASx5O]|nr:hypothetical protein GJQ54_05355 [Oceanospirillaceae bacterium ASx5O]
MSEVKIQNQIGIKGTYSYQVIDDATGDVIVDVPEQDNLILDSCLALPRMQPVYSLSGSLDSAGWLCIGAGVVTPPTVSDTDLGNQIKADRWSPSQITYHSHDDDGVFIKTSNFKDFTGFNGEQVSEIGVRGGTPSGVLYTRALIKDQFGQPTTITVNVGQTLRITYSIYHFIPFILSEGSISTIHGNFPFRIGMDQYMINRVKSGNINEIKSMIGTYSSSSYYLFWTNPSNNQEAYSLRLSSTPVYDTVNRKATVTATFPAVAHDRLLGNTPAPDGRAPLVKEDVNGSKHSKCNEMTLPPGAQRMLLPANYDFSITWEITWGRLP